MQEGDVTHFGQPLNAWNVRNAWSDMQRWAEIERRRKEVNSPCKFAVAVIIDVGVGAGVGVGGVVIAVDVDSQFQEFECCVFFVSTEYY